MEVTFLHPVYLWFLASVPFLIALHLISLRFTRRKALLFANFEAIKRVGGGFLYGSILTKNIIFLSLRGATLILLVFSLSGTTLWYTGQGTDFDFVLALDASGSMLADDFTPNRLEAAKDAALLFVDIVSKHSTIGIVSFSGTTFIKQRLTSDTGLVRKAIESIEIEFASGTAIGDAIVSSSNLFEEGGRAKVIILLTDGQSNVGILAEEAISYANKHKITVYTLGVATSQGGAFEDIEIISRIDEDTLQQIADNTGGAYYRVGNRQDLSTAFEEIAVKTEKKIPLRLSFHLLLAALLVLFTEWTLINTRYRTIP
jgi:Ca-activated chloride channel family protein